MASRNQLLIMRAARAGNGEAQLALGRHYLFGGAGLPKNVATALHWLDRAARQGLRGAWMLIGSHIPHDIALQASDPHKLCVWYERAFDDGVMQAGLTWARLMQKQDAEFADDATRAKVLRALQASAQAGIADAQWMLAQASQHNPHADSSPTTSIAGSTQDWTQRAASGGVIEARRALADQAWDSKDHITFLRWAMPLAREAARTRAHAGADPVVGDLPLPRKSDARLLSRCARALRRSRGADREEMENFFQLAAQAGDRQAQYGFGLLLAKMEQDGEPADVSPASANYKRAIHWLTLAGRQGLADAWYAIARIYMKAAFSQRSLPDALRYLEQAALGGHELAQLELGERMWHKRGDDMATAACALRWLQAAAGQGNAQADAMLEKFAPCVLTEWAHGVQKEWARRKVKVPPLLAARIELAAAFGLSRPEALLIDVSAADHGHCLVVNVEQHYARAKRRLIAARSGAQRQTLNRVAHLFEEIDSGPDGPEGNYRQRLYRLNSTLGIRNESGAKLAEPDLAESNINFAVEYSDGRAGHAHRGLSAVPPDR
jgi:TPR repeat protein